MESNTNHTNQSEETADKELENEYDTKQADDDNQGQQGTYILCKKSIRYDSIFYK